MRNTIGTQTWPIGTGGVAFDDEQNSTIAHNEVSWIRGSLAGTPNVFGIGQIGTGNVVGMWVDANRVRNVQGTGTIYGISFNQASLIYTAGVGVVPPSSILPPATRNRVTNNMILDLRSGSTVYPVYFSTLSNTYFTNRDSIFNNSITTTNATVNVYIAQSARPFIWDNIIQSINTNGNALANYWLSVSRPFTNVISSDYNNYDLRNGEKFAIVRESDFATGIFTQQRTFRSINDWRSYTQQDPHSIQGDPKFIADSLHLPNVTSFVASPASNNGAWLNTASQSRDFDGQLRQLGNLTPDIGADEFEGYQNANDLAVIALYQPSGYSQTSDTVLVTTENPVHIQGIVKNLSYIAVFGRVVNAAVDIWQGGNWINIYSTSQTADFDVNETKLFDFTGPTILASQEGSTFRTRFYVGADQNNGNNEIDKFFKVLIKHQATLVSYTSGSVKGLRNKDSVFRALRRLGVAFDSLDRAAQGSLDIDYRPWWTLLWASGDPTIPLNALNTNVGAGGISFKETQEIERFLDAGQNYAKKSLVMTGQNWATYNDLIMINNQITDTEFTHGYLHTSWAGNTPVLAGYNGFIKGAQVYFRAQDSLVSASPDVLAPLGTQGLVGVDLSGIAYYYLTHPATPMDSAAGTTWHGSRTNIVNYAFDWSDLYQTNPVEPPLSINTSGTTRVLRGALDFIQSYAGTYLPVNFVEVKARQLVDGNEITWQVASEKNVSHYAVEVRSEVNGSEVWSSVGQARSGDAYRVVDTKGTESGTTYTYHVVAVDLDGSRKSSETVTLTRTQAGTFSLAQNYPNPFNPTTSISFTVPAASRVTLRVLDLTGKVVREELSDVSLAAGEYTHQFDAKDLSSGTYIYQLTAVDPNGVTTTLSHKMTLNK